jgi:threonine/homoserine/homoserine lactone efflux protein
VLSELFPLLATGFVLGLAYSAVPGAVNTEALRRGIAGGFRPAALVQTGALLGDLGWAMLGLTGAVVLIQNDAIATLLGIAGAVLLCSLARSAIRAALAPAEAGGVVRQGRPFVIGMTFSVANPAGLAFWTGLGGGLLATRDDRSPIELAALLMAFAFGSVVWGCGMSAIVTWGRRFAGGSLFRWIDALCAAALSYFGIRLLWSSLRRSRRWLSPVFRLVS